MPPATLPERHAPAGPPTGSLRAAVAAVARAPRLLVACAFDGTVAETTPQGRVRANPRSLAALRTLATAPDTAAAVVSGRALRDLALLSRLPSEVHLVGSHGAETDAEFADRLDDTTRTRLRRVEDEARSLVTATPGTRLELKPAGVSVRFEGVDARVARWVRDRLGRGPGSRSGVRVITGTTGIELSVVPHDKGTALAALRERTAATAVLYLGDDEADEAALARLGRDDLGVRVGDGPSSARHRVAGTEEVAEVLDLVAAARTR